MASTPILPFAVWASGTNQNSVPANDNALRAEILQRDVDNATTAQPASPSDGDTYIIQATHTGTQWATFTPKDLAIFKGGSWYAFAPVEGVRVTVSGALYIYTGGAWTAAGGGGGGAVTQCIPIACSDETTAITAGTAKVTFRMPFAFTLTAVRASLTTAQASGASLVTVDVNEGGSSILSTKLTFDNTEKTTTTATTPPVISDTSLADDAEITIDVDLVESGSVAAGLKVYLIGTKT